VHVTYRPVKRGSFDLFITLCIHEFAEAITEDELKGRRGCPFPVMENVKIHWADRNS